jgi:hypothetical protein
MPGEQLDHLDFFALQDETLGFQEDVRRLKAAEPGIQSFFAQKVVNVKDLQAEANKRAHEEELRFLSQREEELLRQLKESPESAEVSSFFTGLDLVTEAFAGSDVNALVVYGGAGLGKSYNVLRMLARKVGEDKIVAVVGHITPLAFYKLLYQTRAGKVLVLDDIDARTLKNDLFVAMLKAASWSTTGKRVISWHSTSKALEQDGIPGAFEFESKLVVLANGVPDTDEFKAFLNRALVKEVAFTFDEVRRLFTGLALLPYKNTQKEQRLQIVEQLFKSVKASTANVSLRLYVKAMELFCWDPARWQAALQEILQVDKDAASFFEAVEKFPEVGSQALSFMQATGKSRSTFFRLKARLAVK